MRDANGTQVTVLYRADLLDAFIALADDIEERLPGVRVEGEESALLEGVGAPGLSVRGADGSVLHEEHVDGARAAADVDALVAVILQHTQMASPDRASPGCM